MKRHVLSAWCLVIMALMMCSKAWAGKLSEPYTLNGWGETAYDYVGDAKEMVKGATVSFTFEGSNPYGRIFIKDYNNPIWSKWGSGAGPQSLAYVLDEKDVAMLADNKYKLTVVVFEGSCSSMSISSGNTGGGPGIGSGLSAEALAEKIANREQLTDVPTIYLTIPDAIGKELHSVLTKVNNVAEYHTATIQVVDNGTDKTGRKLEPFTDQVEIKLRGNSTATQNDKKPYRLKFGKDATDASGNVTSHKHDLLGLGYKKRNWTLIANALDPAMIRNALTYHLGKYIGMPFCPGYKFVDLVINDDYRGTYMVSDHVEVGSNRIDVDDETGWYIESANGNQIEEPKVVAGALHISVKNPEPKTEAEITALKNEVANYFTVMNSYMGVWTTACSDEDFQNVNEGWRQYFDEESLVRFYVGTNFTGDHDGFMQVKMYKNEGEKMQFGPLWDKDYAYGNWDSDDGPTLAEGMKTGSPYFCNYMIKIMTDPLFVQNVRKKLKSLLDDKFTENILKDIDYLTEVVAQTQVLNHQRWPVGDFPSDIKKLKDYMSAKGGHLTTVFNDIYEDLGGDEAVKKQLAIGTGPEDDLNPISTVTIENASNKSFKVPASKFSSKATNIKVTFTPANTSQSYWGFYGFNGSEWGAKTFSGTTAPSVTVTITDAADIAAVAKNGLSCQVQTNGNIGDLTVKVENTIPEASICTNHTYTTDDCTADADGILHRTCSKCGAEESDVNYYEFTVYPESATTQTVIAKSWTPAADKPNSIATVKITSGLEKDIEGYNIVNSTKNADGVQTCADFRLTDGHPYYSDKKFVAAKATYTRTLDANEEYGMMTLPYKHQNAENADAEFYHIDKVEAGKIYLTAIDPSIEGNASAYLPVIFKRKAGKGSVTVTGTDITVKKSTTTDKFNSTCEGWTITGAVENASVTADGLYKLSDAKTGTVAKDSSVSIAPYRAYLSTTTSAPQTLTLVLPGGEEEVITLSSLVNAINRMKTENVTVKDIESIVDKLLGK